MIGYLVEVSDEHRRGAIRVLTLEPQRVQPCLTRSFEIVNLGISHVQHAVTRQTETPAKFSEDGYVRLFGTYFCRCQHGFEVFCHTECAAERAEAALPVGEDDKSKPGFAKPRKRSRDVRKQYEMLGSKNSPQLDAMCVRDGRVDLDAHSVEKRSCDSRTEHAVVHETRLRLELAAVGGEHVIKDGVLPPVRLPPFGAKILGDESAASDTVTLSHKCIEEVETDC